MSTAESGSVDRRTPTSAPPAGAGAGGRLRRLVLGASLAIGDQVMAVVDEAAERVESERAARPGASPVRTSDVVVPFVVPPAAPTVEPDLRHVVIGALTEAGERAVDLVAATTHTVAGTADRLAPLTSWLWRAPVLDPLRRRADATIERLAERGRLEEDLARRQAHETFGLAVGSVTTSAVIDQVIGDVLDRNLQPILDSALPVALGSLGDKPELLVPLVESIVGQVLTPILDTAIPSVMGDLQAKPEMILPLVQTIVGKALQPILDEALPLVMDDIASQPELLMPLVMGIVDEALEPLLKEALPRVIDVLNEDPDAIRSLMRDQSTGIAVEMTETVRFKAADADNRIDSIVRRVLRRRPTGAPPIDPSLRALPAGAATAQLEVLPSSAVVGADEPTAAGRSAQRDGHPSVDAADAAEADRPAGGER